MADSTDDYGSSDQTSQRHGAVRRTIAKIKNSTGIAHDDRANYANYDDDRPHPHPKVEDLVNTVGYSLIQEIMQYMQSEAGESAIERILATTSTVVARQALNEETKVAARVAAEEAVTGSYDAVERKYQVAWKNLPPLVKTLGIPAVTVYVFFLSLGLLCSLWRFTFLGLS